MEKITVTKALKSIDALLGNEVSLTGTLIVKGEDCFVVENSNALDMRIDLPNDTVDKLLDEVPCSVGGEFLYSDTVIVLGAFTDENKCFIRPQKISVMREEEIFNIHF